MRDGEVCRRKRCPWGAPADPDATSGDPGMPFLARREIGQAPWGHWDKTLGGDDAQTLC